MARFHSFIGFEEQATVVGGVYKETIVERPYFGDVLRDNRSLEPGQGVNDNINVGNYFSVVGDAYSNLNFHAIRYVKWAGANWKVTRVEVQRPRLLITVGGVYNGPTP